MTKNQQIKEMAGIFCDIIHAKTPPACLEDCNYKCKYGSCAEAIYNAGYRKVVIRKDGIMVDSLNEEMNELRKTFTSDFASDTQKAYKEGYVKGIEDRADKIDGLLSELKRVKKAFEDYVCKDETKQHNIKVENLTLKEQNERLQNDLVKQFKKLEKQAQKAITKAVKEFAEKLKAKAFQGYQVGMYIVSTEMIDELLKEFLENE